MSEQEILDQIVVEMNLAEWWTELIGNQKITDKFDDEEAAKGLPRTEVTAAQKIKEKFENILSYTERDERWYIWDGRVHTPCEGTLVAFNVAKLYYAATCDALDFIENAIETEAEAVRKSGAQDSEKNAQAIRDKYNKTIFPKHRNFRDRMATEAGLSALVRIMRSELVVDPTKYENDQKYFVMRDWVLDLEAFRENGGKVTKGTFIPHSADMPITRYFDADYNPNLNLGWWDQYLERSIPSKAQRDYLQMVAGAAYMGMSKLRCIINLSGMPGTGKSVFVDTLHSLGSGGAGYSEFPDSRALTKVSGQNFEQDMLRSKRFIAISEPASTERIDDDFLKKFSGDDYVMTRTLNVKSSGWIPQGIIFVASNAPLKINTRDKAIVERVQMIEFPVEFQKVPAGMEHTVPEEIRAIDGLEAKIREDRSRVLTWIILGMRAFIQNGCKLTPPDEVVRMGSQNVSESSTALRFIEEYMEDGLIEFDPEEDPEYMIGEQELYGRYQIWCSLVGERRHLSKKFFVQDVNRHYNVGNKTAKHGTIKKLFGFRPTLEYRAQFAIKTQLVD
jgi:phage/plasmid-associated DNA primase